MSQKVSAFADASGQPNLEALQYLQKVLTPAVIAALLSKSPLVVETAITADATGGVEVDIPLGAKIIDMWAIATATNGSGSVTLKTGAETPATIATAIALATDQAISRLAAGFDDTKQTVGADGIKLFTNGAADRGLVYVMYTV